MRQLDPTRPEDRDLAVAAYDGGLQPLRKQVRPKITQQRIADALGYTQSAVAYWELQKRFPGADAIISYLNFLTAQNATQEIDMANRTRQETLLIEAGRNNLARKGYVGLTDFEVLACMRLEGNPVEVAERLLQHVQTKAEA